MGPHGTAGRSADGISCLSRYRRSGERHARGAGRRQPGPGEGIRAAPETGRIRPSAAGSTPTTGCGATPARWRAPAQPGTSARPHQPPHHGYRNAVMILVGVGAVMAAVAWVIVLLSPASEHPLDSATQDHAGQRAAAHAGRRAERGAGRGRSRPATRMVELQATTSHGTVVLVGVAVAEGGLVATTADLLQGLRRIDMVGPGGKLQAASVVAMDDPFRRGAGHVPEDLPVAPFAADTAVGKGAPDLALTFVAAGGHAVALHCTPGAVTAVGTAIAGGPATTMPSITSSPSTPSVLAGEPAPGRAGGRCSASSTTPTRVRHLPRSCRANSWWAWPTISARRTGSSHGWLGVEGTTPPAAAAPRWRPCGRGGPASGHLQVGERIVAMNRHRSALWPSCGRCSTCCRPDAGHALGAGACGHQGGGRHPRRHPPSMRG